MATYIPKNVRETGIPAAELMQHDIIKANNYKADSLFLCVEVSDFGRDAFGNGTSHYTVECRQVPSAFMHNPVEAILQGASLFPCTVLESGSRREQHGYGNDYDDHAVFALTKYLGYDLEQLWSNREDRVIYRIKNI